MSAADFFAAARAYKRELTGEAAVGLTQEEVDALNAVAGRWKRPAGAAGPEDTSRAGGPFPPPDGANTK